MHTTAPPPAAQPQNEIQMNVETVLLCVNTKLDFTGNNQSILHQVFFITTLGKIAEAFFKYFLLAGYHLMI